MWQTPESKKYKNTKDCTSLIWAGVGPETSKFLFLDCGRYMKVYSTVVSFTMHMHCTFPCMYLMCIMYLI